MSTLTPAWNKARHHILISNFRAFISPKCHPAGLVNYWQTDTNAKGHIKEAKSSGPGRACPLLLPSTGRQTLLMLHWKLTVTLRLKYQHMIPDPQPHCCSRDILCSAASLVWRRAFSTITRTPRQSCELSDQIMEIKSSKSHTVSTAYRLLKSLWFDYCSSFLLSKNPNDTWLGMQSFSLHDQKWTVVSRVSLNTPIFVSLASSDAHAFSSLCSTLWCDRNGRKQRVNTD